MAITKASGNAVAPAAKGDLVVGNATNDSGVLSVGANDTVLTADSSTATGLKWAALPASGSMTLLSTTTLSGSQTVVSGISGSYLHLYVAIDRFSLDGAAGEMYFQPNSSGNIHNIYVAAATWSNSTGALLFTNGGAGQNGTNNSTGIWVMNYAATNMFKPIIAFGGNTTSGSATRAFITGGMLHETSAVTSIMVRPSANNFNGGTMRIYGVN